MRLAYLLPFLIATVSCGSTVYRVAGQDIAPSGPARTECEEKQWLVLAPTNARIADPVTKLASTHQGLGIYRVGSQEPLDLPDLRTSLPPSPILERKAHEVEPYDERRYWAIGLGSGGAIAMAIGTMLFVSAFETVKNSQGENQQHIRGGRAAFGAISIGTGFGLGIAGLVVNPNHAARTRANASRYVFLPDQDDPKAVEGLVRQHNDDARDRCQQSPSSAGGS